MVADISDQFVHLMGECSKIIVISKNTDASNMEKSVLFHATKDGRLEGLVIRQRISKVVFASYFAQVD